MDWDQSILLILKVLVAELTQWLFRGKGAQKRLALYGSLRFDLARLAPAVQNAVAIIQEKNVNGILEGPSLRNQREAIDNIYNLLKSSLGYLWKRDRPAAYQFISAYGDQSERRKTNLLRAIKTLQQRLGV